MPKRRDYRLAGPPLSVRLPRWRSNHRLTVMTAATAAGLTPGRWSDLEAGRSPATTEEQTALLRLLQLPYARLKELLAE